MSELRYPQWRDANDHGKYPFSMRVSLTNDTVLVPENLFADARLYPIGGNQDQFLSRITKTDTEVLFYVSDPVSGSLAMGAYQIGSPSDRQVIHLKDAYGRSAGVLVTDADRLLPLLGWVSGDYDFTIDQTAFVCGVITPMPRAVGLRGIRVDDSSFDSVTNDVYIVGGRGVVLELGRSGTDIVITVHAIGEPLYKQILCAGVGFVNPCKLKTINGIKADPYGNFQIVPCGLETVKTVIRVEAITNGIRISTVGNTG